MTTVQVNGVGLFHERLGTGDIPLVLVHGSWNSHHDWDLVAEPLGRDFDVVTYDRRGHSQSERERTQGSIKNDVADLAALIETLHLAPAWVVGNSLGGTIALRLAAERADLTRGVIAHEPPLMALLDGDPDLTPALEETGGVLQSVAGKIAAGDGAGGARQFVDEIALGPGGWDQLPEEARREFVENAPTFLDELNDPDLFQFEPEWLDGVGGPIQLTCGDESPPLFRSVVSRLAAAVPAAETQVFEAAGHIPHITMPEAFCRTTRDFIHRAAARHLAR